MRRKQRKIPNKSITLLSWICVFAVIAILYEPSEPHAQKPHLKLKVPKFPNQLSQQDFYDKYWNWIKKVECGPHATCCNTIKGDPGGYTCFGVTVRDHPDYHIFIKMDPKRIKTKQKGLIAASVLYKKYYLEPRIHMLPEVWQLAVFDFSINSGPKRAIKELQKLVKAKVDGSIGPSTVEKVKKYGLTEKKVNKYIDTRLHFMQNLKKLWKKHGRGWTKRINDLRGEYAKNFKKIK